MVHVKHASKYEDWAGEYNWSTCRTGREEYGKFLLSVLTSQQNGFVLNLNGTWGSGKTQFLRRLYVELAEQNYPVVYIDAWESDFVKDPLVVVCTEILNQLGYLFENAHKDGRKKKLLQKLEGNFIKLQGSFATLFRLGKSAQRVYEVYSGDSSFSAELQLLDDLAFQETNLISLPKGVNDTNESLLKQVQGGQNQLIAAMKDIRKQVSTISLILHELYDLELPIVVFVDELDRCRPDYAVEMLEIIKHFFEVEGCAFLVATDTNALETSIKSIYGSKFESERYLRRFFNQRIKLPRPSINDFVKTRNIDFEYYKQHEFTLYPYSRGDQLNLLISAILNRSELELRDIEQILDRLEACLGYITTNRIGDVDSINVVVLTYGILEQHLGYEHFDGRKNDNVGSILPSSVKVFGTIGISDFVASQLAAVTTREVSKVHNFRSGGYTDYGQIRQELAIVASDMNLYRNGDWVHACILDVLESQYRRWQRESTTYWLWEDYKKLIGLSANIE